MSHQPIPIKSLLKDLLGSQVSQHALTLQTVRENWGELINQPAIAHGSAALKLFKGTLWIGSTNPTWAYEMQFMQPYLLLAIQTLCGKQAVQELRFQHVSQLPCIPLPQPAPPSTVRSNSVQKNFQQLRSKLH